MKRLTARGLAAVTLAGLAAPAFAALDVAGLDKSADACTDFYQYANQTWMTRTPIPADRPRWTPMDEMGQKNELVLKDILDKALKAPRMGGYKQKSPEWMAINYYRSGLNQNRLEYWNYTPVRPFLVDAAALSKPEDIARFLGKLHANGIPAAFAFSVDADRKNSTQYLAEIEQGGLGLPDRDYYFRDDEKTKGLREAYKVHVEKMFTLIEESPGDAKRDAERVFAFETELAKASMTAVERRDVEKTYNKMTRAELATLAPGFPWEAYFEVLGAKHATELNVAQPEFMKALGRLAQEQPAEWAAYLRWHVIHAAATKLSPRFVDENFDFYEKQLRGVKEQAPKYREVLRTMGGPFGSQGLGMALGKLYVDATFPPEAKARALQLVQNVKAALRDRLKAASWMTEETRKRALEKVDTMQVKIGYPDKWRDYTGAEVGQGGQGTYAENWMAANRFDHQRDLSRIGKPVDKADWLMSPHVVNAYYNPTGNEIVFPAAILQPPYFDAKADDAINYGGIGMVIGHEITHGFDNRGRRFDKDGNMRDWWAPEDEKRYNDRAQVIIDQYGAMDAVDGVKPNGALTQGENIADIGGLKIAYDALQKALKGKPRAKIDGLTPEQRFFISFAQGWRANARTEYERNQVLTGQHSLPRFRVKGPIAHMPEFAKAFSCDASRTLLPESTTTAIW